MADLDESTRHDQRAASADRRSGHPAAVQPAQQDGRPERAARRDECAVAAAPRRPAAAPAAPPAASLGERIVARARAYVGVPYLWGGESRAGMDCSGLVYRALLDLGITAPRTSAAQADWATPVSVDEARPGDLAFFYSPVSHVGIYVGGGRMIDASEPGTTIVERAVGTGAMFGRVP